MEHEERKPDAKKHLLAIFGCDHTIDEFTSIYAISAYHPRQGALKTTLCGKTIASYLWQVGFFFWVLWFPQPINLTVMMCGIKH